MRINWEQLSEQVQKLQDENPDIDVSKLDMFLPINNGLFEVVEAAISTDKTKLLIDFIPF